MAAETKRILGLALALAVAACAAHPLAQANRPGLRLYVLDCGTLIYNNPESYNLTRQDVRNTNMSVPCYLAAHPRGSILFDTGLSDTARGRPFNESPLGGAGKPSSTSYFMLVTRALREQLTAIGFPPNRIDYLALSHFHADHSGNANDFTSSTWLVQRPEHEAMFGPKVPADAINPGYRALKDAKTQILDGDHDVFGDGTVVLKFTPGHTPGHQSLYVKLPQTGGVVLSGDLYHYPEERALDRMPEREKTTGTAASRTVLEAFMKNVKAELWIAHDISRYSSQKKSPEYYE